MKKYRCTACDYLYNPEVGDPENGIAAGTPFEELPEDWTCPLCGLGKEAFEAEEQIGLRCSPAEHLNYLYNKVKKQVAVVAK